MTGFATPRGALVACAAALTWLLAPGVQNASADSIKYTLNMGSSGGLDCCTGPYATVTITLTSSTTAIVTFDSLTNGGYIYLLGSSAAADLNVNGSYTLGTVSETSSIAGFTPTFELNQPGVVDGFGTFNLALENFDGFTDSATVITFSLTLNSGTWPSAANVLTPNNDGHIAAICGFACAQPGCSPSGGASYVGFASDGTTTPANPGWLQEHPQTNPPALFQQSMAYDSARAQTVIFGGEGSDLVLVNNTWVWDGVSWTQKNPVQGSPAARLWYGNGMAYDAKTGTALLFGGSDAYGNFLSDTWVWDGASWTQLNPARSPPGTDSVNMAYDAASGQVVMVIGTETDDETWLWNGADWRHPTVQSPPPGAMAYDSTHRKVVDFDGFLQNTWLWNGQNWSQQHPSQSPPERLFAGMADDPARNQVILFGGGGSTGDLSDTWAWDGVNWTSVSPPGSPPARHSFSMAFDVAHGKAVLVGGIQNGGQLFFNDTWVWSGYLLTNTPLKGTSGITDLELNAYTIPVITIVDHSMTDVNGKYHIYGYDGTVTAFTNEVGECSYTPPPCPGKRDGYYNSTATSFGTTGHYIGDSSDSGTIKLQYEGHPGFDYEASCTLNPQNKCKLQSGTNVYAVTSGTIHYPTTMVGLGGPPSQYHVLELTPDNAVSPEGVPYLQIYYLHLSTYSTTPPITATDPSPAPGCPASVTLPLAEGTHAGAGCLIAESGNTAPPPGVGPHLHFEVQRVLPHTSLPSATNLNCQVNNVTMTCVPVDPYGSSCGSDPYFSLLQIPNVPLWNVSAYLSANSLCFGTLGVGASDQQEVVLTNAAATTLSALTAVISGADSGDFNQANGCPSSLAPGQTCQLGVTFTPAGTGNRTATLTITGTDGGGPVNLVVQLSGTAR